MPAATEFDCDATTSVSSEKRWFGSGEVPTLVRSAIRDFPYSAERRIDRYLAEQGTCPAAPAPDLGVKIRAGERFEIKVRAGERAMADFTADEWHKTSFPLVNRPPAVEWTRPRWLEVAKSIEKVTWCHDGRGWSPCAPGAQVSNGASLECCEISVGEARFWSAAIDCWTPGVDESALVSRLAPVAARHARWTLGYPEFLATIGRAPSC